MLLKHNIETKTERKEMGAYFKTFDKLEKIVITFVCIMFSIQFVKHDSMLSGDKFFLCIFTINIAFITGTF